MIMGSEFSTSSLIDFASDPAFGVGSNMLISGWNEGAEQLLGYSRSESIGKSCSQILQALYSTGEPLCSILCEGRACFVSGKKWGISNCRIRHKNGNMINVGLSSLVLPQEIRTSKRDDTVAIIFLRQDGGNVEDISTDNRLRIFSLGEFGLAVAGKGLSINEWKRKQAATVLKCLVCQLDKPVHRERLIEWLWPETDAGTAWQRLKVTISYLRGQLRKAGAQNDIIETIGQSYLLRGSAVWVDAEVFTTLVSAGSELLKTGNLADAQDRFEEAESLYRGEYFGDQPYADWCALERERLLEIYLEMLSGMTSCYSQQGNFVAATRICRLAMSTDPSRESFVRALMENLIRLERPDWARSQFMSWRKTLNKEYGLQPTSETLHAFKQLGEY